MTNAKRLIVTSGQDNVLPTPLRCLEVVFLKSLRKDDFSNIYFCLSSFCGSPAMKRSILRCRDDLNLSSSPPPPPPPSSKIRRKMTIIVRVMSKK